MAENPTNDNSNDRDPLEEFLKKMQEQGFDPNAEQNGNGTADNPFAFLNGNINPEDMNAMGMSFDPSMLQGIFAQVQSMFTAGASENGINWQGVKDQARQLLATTGEDPAITESLRAATRDASNLADLWLDSVTIFERHNIPVEAWSKAEWLDSSFESWRDMVQPVAAEVTQAMVLPSTEDVPEELAQLLGGTGFLNNIGSMIFGAQMAQALTELAGEVYSSTDIGFPLAPGRSALLPAGYTQLAEDIEVPAQEILLYLAVREAALIRLHRTNPWLREDILELVSRYARGIRVDMNRIQDAASQVDLSNPEAVQDAFDGGLFNPQRTEDQELAVERLEALLALVEGWVSLVAEQATQNLPTAPQLAETLVRRRIEGGPTERVFETLVGLEIRPRLVREAQNFWRTYEEKHGYEARDELWAAPETLPTATELEDPDAYEARQDEFKVEDIDFDTELQKLLDGGFDEGESDGGESSTGDEPKK